MTSNDAFEFLVELISQMVHSDLLITEQAERIETLEADNDRLRAMVDDREVAV